MLPEEYTLLFNAVTKTIEALEEIRDKLIKAQQDAEETYISR